MSGEAGLHFSREVKEAYLTDMLEEDAIPVDLAHIPFHGFEIQTIKVVL
uniref:Uncharacterized protein n=1 Tax=uncultured Bacillota bacterium TaxID=344338 RepID=A0A650ENE8_9FIRM|nr:hypothetical protein Firmicute1046_0280 [uncultured Firmicutes bacterium]